MFQFENYVKIKKRVDLFMRTDYNDSCPIVSTETIIGVMTWMKN